MQPPSGGKANRHPHRFSLGNGNLGGCVPAVCGVARCWRRCACWWATIPRPVPRQAATRDRPYGSCGKGRPYGGGRPRGIAPTVRVAKDRPYGEEGGHKGSPLRFVWQGIAPTARRAATRDRPYGSCGKGSPLRRGGRPRGIAPTVRVARGVRTVEGGHEGSPLRRGGRPQGIAPTVRVARDRPYGEEGGHEGSPLRFVWQGASVRWRAATRDRPYGEDGGHKGSPLRGGGRPQGIAPTARRAATRDRPYGSCGKGRPYGGGRPGGMAHRCSVGAEGQTRTADTWIFSPLLYQLSYLGP